MDLPFARGGTGWPRSSNREVRRRLLFGCGAASTALYIAMDAVSALRYNGYSYLDQTISELSTVDAPTRSLWIALTTIYAPLEIAGGFGVWMSSGSRRTLRIVAVAIVTMGVVALLAWPFAPMHKREVLAAGGGTVSDTLHLALGGVDTLLFVTMMIAGALSLGRRFRAFSLMMLAVMLGAGTLSGLKSAGIESNDPTPWLGIVERITVFGSMVWISALGIVLMRRDPAREPSPAGRHR